MKTNLKNFAMGMLLATAMTPFVACNSDVETTYTLPTSATVRSFSLSANADVLPNLDSVFFSIDLYSGEIFNADSLPFGTRVNALVPVILTDGAQVIELSVPRVNNIDTVYNYLENTTDSIDFSNGPVKMRVVSLDGKTERNYTIKVNVHTVRTDTLVWSRIEGGNLPTDLSAVTGQHTAMSPDGRFYCLTTYQSAYRIATTTDPSGSWNIVAANIGFDADVNSFTATTQALYLLDKSGNLYASSDNGLNWTSTGEKAADLLGAYAGTLLATVNENSSWHILEYPTGIRRPAPQGFPVRNSSTSLTVTYEMSVRPQFIIVGGRTADNKLTGTTWGYDGTGWATITKRAVPEALENMAVVPYFNVTPDTASWRVSSKSTILLAMNGNRENGVPNDTVYMSSDFGMHWDKAPANMQLPTKVVPSRTYTQAYPYTITRNAAKAPAVRPAGKTVLMAWTDLGYTPGRNRANASRATEAITEWDVPYIYLFGGVNADGTTYNTVFRGVITSLTFKPLQ